MGPGGGKPGNAHSVGKEKVNIIDQDGYELVERTRRLRQHRAKIFAVERKDQEIVFPRSCQRQEIVLPRSCQIKFSAEKVARRSCATDGVARKKLGAAPESLQRQRNWERGESDQAK